MIQFRTKALQAEQERLENFPNLGSLTPDEWLNRQGYKMVICEKQFVIYRLIGESVYIYHIADTRTEYTKKKAKQFNLLCLLL